MRCTRTSTLALLLVAALVGCGQRSDEVATAGADRTGGLAGVEWQLVEVTGADGTWQAQGLDSVLRFDGRGGWSATACNAHDGTSQHGDGWVELTWVMSTEVACDSGALGRVEREVRTNLRGRVDVELEDGTLRLGPADGTQLVYRERASVYPFLQGRTVVAGERGQAQYRVALGGSGPSLGLHLEARRAPGLRWDQHSFGAPEPELEPGIWTSGHLEVDGEQLVAGFAPTGTVRVTHLATTGDAAVSELDVEPVAGSPWVVWHGFVDAHTADSRFTASAADGTVLKAW